MQEPRIRPEQFSSFHGQLQQAASGGGAAARTERIIGEDVGKVDCRQELTRIAAEYAGSGLVAVDSRDQLQQPAGRLRRVPRDWETAFQTCLEVGENWRSH